MKTLSIVLLLASSLTVLAQTEERRAIQELKEKVVELAQADLNCQEDAECLPVALGHRACGGPSDYTFTSVKNQALEEIKAKAKETRDRQKAITRRSGGMSICRVEPAPNLMCHDGTCMGH